MNDDADTDHADAANGSNGITPNRRILKVRLRQDQVIRLHELRILQGKSIASLLEGMIEEYLKRQDFATSAPSAGEKQASP